jgi:hypothetical protein
MSVTASPARATAASAADTNDRPAGNRRSSEVCDRNTRRGTTESAVPVSGPRDDPNAPTLTHSRCRSPRRYGLEAALASSSIAAASLARVRRAALGATKCIGGRTLGLQPLPKRCRKR